jgi:hypothetical protein
MRLALPLAVLALLAAPAYAQTAPPVAVSVPAPSSPAVSAPAPASRAASSSAAAPAPHHRLTMNERFTKANTTHDGHLTLEQAKAGYPTLTRHFTDIDAAKHGYVTVDDIRAWQKAERDRRHAAQPATTPLKG